MSVQITAETRNTFGKATKGLRGQGLIPAELYGHGTENLHLTVPAKEFIKVFRSAGESTLVDLVVSGKKWPVLIHDIAVDPATEDILSVDFYQVRLDERIKVKVPIHFTGEAAAVKEKGGILVKAMQEIEVEAFPANIPHSIQVDLGKIADIGVSIYVKDIVVPNEVKVLVNLETVVATVTEKAAEEEVAVAAPSVESVKVETEEKKAERAAKKEAPDAAGAKPSTKE